MPPIAALMQLQLRQHAALTQQREQLLMGGLRRDAIDHEAIVPGELLVGEQDDLSRMCSVA